LKIQHALKETSYLTDGTIFAISGAIATTIGNNFWAAPHQTEPDCATNCKEKPSGLRQRSALRWLIVVG
jgi:hypothetical protein